MSISLSENLKDMHAICMIMQFLVIEKLFCIVYSLVTLLD